MKWKKLRNFRFNQIFCIKHSATTITFRRNSAYSIASNGTICNIRMVFHISSLASFKNAHSSCSNWICGVFFSLLVFRFDMWYCEWHNNKADQFDGFNLRELEFCEWYIWESWWSLLGRDADERFWDASSSQYDTYRRLKDINSSQSSGMIISCGGDDGNSSIGVCVCNSSCCALATS